MKNDYLIKYAAMPVKDYFQNPRCYIVSKCYVLEKKEKYSEYDDNRVMYKVIFPYQYITDDFCKRAILDYKIFINSESNYNTEMVANIYDTYEEAKEEKIKLNNSLLIAQKGMLGYRNFDKNSRFLEQEHNRLLEKYQELEDEIEENTKYLSVNRKNQEQKIIICRENKYEIVKEFDALYKFISLNATKPFCVCNLTDDEYNSMELELQNKGTITIKDHNLLRKMLINDGESKKTRIVNYHLKREEQTFWIMPNCYMGYGKNVSQIPEKHNFDECIKVYTTETYEDVLMSFASRYIGRDDYYKIPEVNIIGRKYLSLK